MLTINLIAIGKNKDASIADLCSKYQKLLGGLAQLSIQEMTPKIKGNIQDEEGKALLEFCPDGCYKIILDERGKNLTTVQFANQLEKIQVDGVSQIAFLIGGADGHTDMVRSKADLVLSLSPMTFPHMMVRPLILEQLFRALSYNSGHPYHRS